MCGIVGYIGNKQAAPILLKGLRRLEYRGYDSAGVALIDPNGSLNVYKTRGKVNDLERIMEGKNTEGTVGIAHTRWATHGEPSDVNAHPHCSSSRNLAMIHNGIVENYTSIREMLSNKGYAFKSTTDTEVLVQFVDYLREENKLSLADAVQMALCQVVGAYAIAVIEKNNPNQIVAARKGSPLVVGIGENEYFLASDATPIVEYTQKVIYVGEEEIVELNRGEDLKIKTISDVNVVPEVQMLEMSLSELEKGGYPHFMLKEIFEQPRALENSMKGRVSLDGKDVVLSGFRMNKERFLDAKRILILACGTSWHAGLIGKYMIEEFARIPVEVEYSSEFRYRKPVIYENDIVIPISQSGETADTLAAVNLAKSYGAFIFGICNVVGSSIPRMTDSGCYTHVGPEIGVASTKAFTAQVTVLVLLALCIAKEKKTISKKDYHEIISELNAVPEKMGVILRRNEEIASLSRVFTYAQNFIYLGRGYNYPLALEGALKLKEISYIHAEGYPAAEMKHGPIALIGTEMPVVVIATHAGMYEKVINNIQEIKARKGRVIAIVTKGDTTVRNMSDFTVEIPETMECLVPLLASIPLQLLAYHIAVQKGCDVDQPRNLAKSVTVE